MLQRATGCYDIRDYYIVHDKHEDPTRLPALSSSQAGRDLGMLEEFSDRDIEANDGTISAQSKDNFQNSATKSPTTAKKEKKNPILGQSKTGSIVVKIINKLNKNEVAMKEINKKGKRQSEIDKLRRRIRMYQVVQHHYIVKLEDYFETNDKFYLCLEMHSSITLY